MIPYVGRVDPEVFFVGGVIQQLVEIRTHTQRLSVGLRESGLRGHGVLERELCEGLLFVREKLVDGRFSVG